MEPEIKELGLKALLEKGEIEKFFDVQMKEKDGQAKGQLIGSIARIADMVTQHSEGVFVEEISQRLSEKLAELASQLASGLEADLKGTEEDLRRFVETTDAESRSEILADLAQKVEIAESNLSRQIQNTLDEAMPELADAARLSEDERQELVDAASLSVESQMSELIGAYFADHALSAEEIQGFKNAVQQVINDVDFSQREVDYKQLRNIPNVLDNFVKSGGKFRLKFMVDVDTEGITNGQALVWNSTTRKFEPGSAGVDALADIGNVADTAPTNNQVLTWNSTSEKWEPADAPGAAGGEANTAANLGTGEGVYSTKVGVELRFKSLVGGTGITLSSDSNEITIDRDALAASDIASGTFADARIAESNVTQHQAALSITESQISDLGSYLTDITGENLSTLADVTITSIANGELLRWNGSAWVNNTLAEAGIQPLDTQLTSLAGLTPGTEGRLIESDGLGGFQMATAATVVQNAGALMDSEVDADIKTLSLPANTTISAFGATLVDDADAATARTTLGVDAAGTDNSTNVTLAGTPDYITISGQTITRNQIDLTADVTGVLPEANLPNASTTAEGVVELATTAETQTGTDTARATTPAGVAAAIGDITFIKATTIESPTGTEDIGLFFTDEAITITQMNAVLRGSSTPSVTWTVRHNSDRSATGVEVVTSGTTTTSTTTGSEVTSFNDATIPAGSWVWLETTAQSGTVDELSVSIEYTRD